MDSKAFYQLSYGVFLLTARQAGKDNGCVINTAIQCASEPLQMSVCVINQNLTCDMIKATGRFNVSVIPQSTPYRFFQDFGQRSGRTLLQIRRRAGHGRGTVYARQALSL